MKEFLFGLYEMFLSVDAFFTNLGFITNGAFWFLLVMLGSFFGLVVIFLMMAYSNKYLGTNF